MGFNASDLLKLGGQSFTTATAYIKIRDLRKLGDEAVKTSAAEKASGGSALGMKGLNKIPGADKALNNLKNKAEDAAKNAAGRAISSVAGDTIGGMITNKLGLNGSLTNDDYDKVFKVQFNPSSLQITSQGGGEIVQKSVYSEAKGGTTIEMGVTMPHVEMAVQLIFDGLDANYKAFAADLANFSSTNLINEGLDLVEGLATEKLLGGSAGLGVQTAVEGFVGAMLNRYTRQVCFEWGDLYYEGEMKSINASYTMFDSVGRPVRALVNMAIYLEDDNISNSDMGYWETAYDEVFEKGSVDLSGGKILGTAKSVLNF